MEPSYNVGKTGCNEFIATINIFSLFILYEYENISSCLPLPHRLSPSWPAARTRGTQWDAWVCNISVRAVNIISQSFHNIRVLTGAFTLKNLYTMLSRCLCLNTVSKHQIGKIPEKILSPNNVKISRNLVDSSTQCITISQYYKYAPSSHRRGAVCHPETGDCITSQSCWLAIVDKTRRSVSRLGSLVSVSVSPLFRHYGDFIKSNLRYGQSSSIFSPLMFLIFLWRERGGNQISNISKNFDLIP